VTLADVAPTQAKLLHFGFDAPDGKAIPDVPRPGTPPPLIITLVWDAGGLTASSMRSRTTGRCCAR
jgi:hypothetical protein